jgi:glycine cleavage system H lipoate-binding protein
MRCPFLREAQVKFCRASAYKKMIVRLAEQTENERCSSREYVNCPAAKAHLEENPSIDHCLFLQESLVQYCTAAAVTKYIPYSESALCQCGTESHKYCELYLGLSQPSEPVDESVFQEQGNNSTHLQVDDIKIPKNLFYSPNHMWIEVGSDGVYHIGVDAFLTKVLGAADHITFVTTKGYQRPTVSFSVRNVDLQFVFPMQLNITRANTYLRTNPEKIFSDPYTVGWLFEATDDRNKNNTKGFDGLISGKEAYSWMKHEVDRMTSLAHLISAQPDMHGAVLMADGGSFQPGFTQQLTREELLKLFNDFFSPLAVWETPQ